MNYINKILLLFALLGLGACTREDIPGGEDPIDNTTIRLTISADGASSLLTKATTDGASSLLTKTILQPEPGTPGEREYSSLYLYVFKGDKLVHEDNTQTGSKFPKTMTIPQTLENAGELTIYAFASPDPDITMPTGPATTPDDLKALSTTGMSQYNAQANIGKLLYIDTDARKIPMSHNITHDFMKDGVVAKLGLKRTVAKLRIRIVDKTPEAEDMTLGTMDGLTIKNLRSTVSFQPLAAGDYTSNSIPLFASQTFGTTEHDQTTLDGRLWTHTAYINEHLFD